MLLLTLGKRRKVSATTPEPPKEIRGLPATIAACDTYPVYIYNKYCIPKSLQHPAEPPLNERQMREVQEYKAKLLESIADDLASAETTP